MSVGSCTKHKKELDACLVGDQKHRDLNVSCIMGLRLKKMK